MLSTQEIPLHLIDDLCDTRTTTSDERVEYLCNLRMNGQQLPAVTLYLQKNGRYVIGQGRHRTKCARRLGDKVITAIVIKREMTAADFVSDLESNAGGPLPLSPIDCVHSARRLLEHYGKSPAWIRQNAVELKPYLRKAQDDAIYQSKVRAAEADVKAGKCSMQSAAKKHGVRLSAVKQRFETETSDAPGDFKNGFERIWTGLKNNLRGKRAAFSRAVTEGRISPAAALDVMDYDEQFAKSVTKDQQTYAAKLRNNF